MLNVVLLKLSLLGTRRVLCSTISLKRLRDVPEGIMTGFRGNGGTLSGKICNPFRSRNLNIIECLIL